MGPSRCSLKPAPERRTADSLLNRNTRGRGPTDLSSRQVLDLRIDATSYEDATGRILDWCRQHQARYVCVCNVHMIMEAFDDPGYRDVVNSADLVTPDGMPVVWCLRLLGVQHASRVYGPELTPRLIQAAARAGVKIGFYGGAPDTLDALVATVVERYPDVEIAYAHSPPFRTLTPEEDTADVRAIRQSGVQVLFVGLGCPKQERWMADHRDRLSCVMLGVGAAFDFVAGAKAQAPRWVQGLGLEWLFRLLSEPRRLWKRYLKQNPRFVYNFGIQLMRRR